MRGKQDNPPTVLPEAGITPADAGKTLSVLLTPSAFQDHPRGCGENLPTIIIEIVKSGSPPRMRGKHEGVRVRERGMGITPADAGKTLGEGYEINYCTGSPPRMRGKPDS